jgi:hypothetical protein
VTAAAAAAAGDTTAELRLTSLLDSPTTTPHAQQQLVLGPGTFAGSSMVVVTSTTAPYIEW